MPQITLRPPENVLSHDRVSKSRENINRRITRESLSKSVFSNGGPCACFFRGVCSEIRSELLYAWFWCYLDSHSQITMDNL